MHSKMPAPAAFQADTLNKFLTAWKTQNVRDTVDLWSEDFTQRLLPLSLGLPPKSRSEAEMVNAKIVEHLTNWKVSNSRTKSAAKRHENPSFFPRSRANMTSSSIFERSFTMLGEAPQPSTRHHLPTPLCLAKSGLMSTRSSCPSQRMGQKSAGYRRWWILRSIYAFSRNCRNILWAKGGDE